MQTRSWEQDGAKRYTTEIIASEMQMLDSKQDSQQEPTQHYQQAKQKVSPKRQAPAKQATPQAGYSDFSDDIPFAPVEF